MIARATISFSQPGVQPPVYVVTSLSDPPWETLELSAEDVKMSSGDLIFSRSFDDAAEGSYQYKIRVGEGHWVVDESKETATDEQGNRNNVIRIKAPPLDIRKDSTLDFSGLTKPHTVPVPFVVVEKVEDQKQPNVRDVEPQSLPVDAAKRAADAEPDIEVVRANSPVGVTSPSAPEVPPLVVEKTDDKLAYGDDFGDDATTTQKVAYEMRAADALPDKFVVASEGHVEPSTKENQAAPLHEHGLDQPESLLTDTIDEVSVQSSTDQTSSGDIVNTPSEENGMSEDDELNHSPLLSHEAGFDKHTGEFDHAPTFPHEEPIDEHTDDELNNGPLLSHETEFLDHSAIHSDDEDELGKAPLLSHESGFSQPKGSGVVAEYGDDDMASPHSGRFFKGRFESNRAPKFSYEALEDDNYGEDEIRTLPHDRNMSAASISGSERSLDDGLFLLDKQPTFEYETGGAGELFGRSGRASIFRTGTSDSTLPHKMPKSDEEDDALRDSSLESFPTSREQILERVATISHRLPEDEAGGEQSSPVMSQACSSVDLRPIKSYASMPSVQEESDDDCEDRESLGSPMIMGGLHTRSLRSFSGFRKDPYATPKPEEEKRLGWGEEVNTGASRNDTNDSSEAGSVGKHDGAKDDLSPLAKLIDSVVAPAKVLDSLTTPLTSNEKYVSTGKENAISASDAELRQRREPKGDSAEISSEIPAPSDDTDDNLKDKVTRITTPDALRQQPDQPSETSPQSLFRAGKRTSVSVLVASVTFVAYYYFG